jgi:hypothetical protein
MMDLNSFKLLKEDGENYHLEHPSGKRLSVSKALLSGPAKKAIEKMCAGGEVQKLEGGGFVDTVQKYMAPDFHAAEQAKSQKVTTVLPNNGTAAPTQARGYADGGSVLDDPSLPPIDQGPPPEAMGSLSARPSTADLVSAQAQPVAQPAQQQPEPLIQHGISQDQLLSQEQGQIADLAKAQGAEAGATTKAYSEYNKAMDKMQTPNDIVAHFKIKDDELMKSYLDHKIDPNNFVKHMSTGSKIAAGISMIFGGIGQGLIGGKNPGMEWLHNAISNDIEAQKNEQGKGYNLWRMNRDAMGDDMRANIATQNQMWTGVQAKVAQAAAAAQAPVAKFRAQQMINEIEKQKIQNRMTLGLMSQGMTGPGGGQFSAADPAQLVQQMVPKELQPKVYEEIGRAQNVARNKEEILSAFDRAANENTVMRTGAGFLRTPGSVMALHQLMLPNFKQIDGTVRQAAMDESFHNLTPAPGDTEGKIAEKRKALIGWMESEAAAPISKGNMLDLSRFQSTSMAPIARLPSEQQQIYQWAKAHPNTEKGKMALDKFKGMGIE